jgi:tetratricopeptide (TPR) repeat protein
MKRLSAILPALVLVSNLSAAGVTTDFPTANRLYSEGSFVAAGAAYEKMLEAGGATPALYFNYGNAEFKTGHLGRAIAAYRQAELLAPRDPDIRANLEFARGEVQGKTVRESSWQVWLNSLTLDEWAVAVAVAFWLTFVLLAATQISPEWGSKLLGLTLTFAAITILSGAALGLQAADHFRKQTAVIVAENVTARSGPFDGAQSAFAMRDGIELVVLDHHDDWLQVADSSGKSGWLQTKQVEVMPGA